MIDDHPELDRRYRAPRAFGPLPGPRNIPFTERGVGPDEVTTSLSVSLAADPDQLARLLPPDTRLTGAAVLTVTAVRFHNLRWLAGRGYPILTVTFPITYVGHLDDDPVDGKYLAVLWEGLADPITTGREELGFPKLFADIWAPTVDDVSADGSVDAMASWDGFQFFDLSADALVEATPEPPAPAKGTIVHRFVPSLGSADHGDIDELVLHQPPGSATARATVTDFRSGTGRFSFHHARFADVPVQYPVINTLADLTLAESGPATLTRTVGTGSTPGAVAPRVLGQSVPTGPTTTLV